MGTLPECGIRSTELLPPLCVMQKRVHTSQPNAMAVALLSQQCLVNPAKQGAPHALGTVPFSGCRLWLLLWDRHVTIGVTGQLLCWVGHTGV